MELREAHAPLGTHRLLSRVPVLVTLFWLALGSPALASNYGSTAGCGYESGNSSYTPVTTCVSKANNRTHAVRLEVVGNQWAGMDTAVINTLSSDYNPTDLVAYVDQSDPYPDVIVYDQDYGLTFPPGWADCPANNSGLGGSNPSRWCRGQIVRFNGSWESKYPGSSTIEGLACHEIGHTLFLRHLDDGEYNSCMEGAPHLTNPADPNGTRWRHATLNSSHDIAHIDLAY